MKKLLLLACAFCGFASAQLSDWKENPARKTENYAQYTSGDEKGLVYAIPLEGFVGQAVLSVVKLSTNKVFSTVECDTYVNLGVQGGSFVVQRNTIRTVAKAASLTDRTVQTLLGTNLESERTRDALLNLCADNADASEPSAPVTLYVPLQTPDFGISTSFTKGLLVKLKSRLGLLVAPELSPL
ncbi:hypothetical protein [Deinococcus cellulosilyticus]|uniref:Uncharacterized protein n=1 Tax=Deinococcus cellulosilyticus (strain DSM 18568 / NBRC 106333 / KACC 11606 / 5516J-15) TaxID=1223518 RepID=A0A511N3C7_DEIC1|nr:hypothetical protein [Deinococcus cellulosilyticus]GEM46916.1 hypothetical protein DC3_25510 [Deinococcus cellulosilyticus NBRC 106333 = KACC 11606]